MSDLRKYTDDELITEMDGRKAKAAAAAIPQPAEKPVLAPAIDACQQFIDSIVQGDCVGSDQHYAHICGLLLKGIYGDGVLSWIRKNE